MTRIKVSLLFLCLLLPAPWLVAGSQASIEQQKVEPWDQGAVNYRRPPYKKIEEWKKLPAYRYDRESHTQSVWNIIWGYIGKYLSALTRSGNWFWIVLAVLGFMLMGLLLLRLFNVPISGLLLYSPSRETSPLHFSEGEHDHSVERLEEMLALYQNNRAWPDAVRVLFLLYLQQLQAQELISIRSYKTNHEYLAELDNPREKALFLKRMTLFDRVWYGQADLSEAVYRKIEAVFGRSAKNREAAL